MRLSRRCSVCRDRDRCGCSWVASSTHTPGALRAGRAGVSRASGGPVGEPLVDDMAGPADGVRAQPQGLGECAVGAPSTQRSSADADAVEHVGHSQHGFGGDPWRHFSFPHSRSRPGRCGRRGGRPGSARLAVRRRWRCLSHQRSFAPPSWGPVGVIWWSWAQSYEAARNAHERTGTHRAGGDPLRRPGRGAGGGVEGVSWFGVVLGVRS